MREAERRFAERLDADVAREPPGSLARALAEFRRHLLLTWLTSPLGRLSLWLAEGGWRR